MATPRPHAFSHRTLSPSPGPQAQLLASAVTEEICGSQDLGSGYVVMTPGHYSRAHTHAESEIVVHVIVGWAATLYGDELEHAAIHGPGDGVYVPAGVPHAAVNLSSETEVRAVETRSDRHFNADVQQRPELDATVAERAADLQQRFASGLLPLLPRTTDVARTGDNPC